MGKPHAIVIGAGFTGVATAHDLALRGFDVTVVERGPIVNGTSGRTHGLLHSGGRYAVTDQESAVECIEENMILRKIVPQVIEQNGGLFIALTDEDLAFGESFMDGCHKCGIEVDELTPKQALELEPNLNPRLLVAVAVPDGTFDPLRLALAFAATAKSNGARFNLYNEVEDMVFDGKGDVIGLKVWDRTSDRRYELFGDVVINATGAWAGQLTEKVHSNVSVTPAPGVMVAYNQRLVQRAINRLCKPSDGDIIVPQRRMLVVGTTSFSVEDVDYIPMDENQVEEMLKRGAALIPGILNTKERGAYMATRPLIKESGPGRSISRTFKAYDHKAIDNVDGFITITGGKATTMRGMAEKVVDMACAKLGVNAVCATTETPLLSYREYYRLPN
jgi:glycerol-3-phosphate dehydrogenase